MSKLSIVHWNDVYRVTPQKVSPRGDTIDVTQFAALLDDIRRRWRVRSDGARDGLSLFSGDLFSPSVESTVTRGSHMVRRDEGRDSCAESMNRRFNVGSSNE
jgi:5'-nucleotidase